MNKALRLSFEPGLLSEHALPSNSDWSPKIFQKQLFGMNQGFVHISLPHYCMMEGRLILEGKETIFGIAVESVPGESLRDKRSWLNIADQMQLQELTTKGWCVQHTSSHLAVLPSGFFHILLAEENTICLRWSISSDEADNKRVEHLLLQLVSDYKELGDPSKGYKGLIMYLQADSCCSHPAC